MHKSLTNFNVPDDTKTRFDAICHLSGRTRTSVLVELMNDYILNQSRLIVVQNEKLQMIDQMLEGNQDSNG